MRIVAIHAHLVNLDPRSRRRRRTEQTVRPVATVMHADKRTSGTLPGQRRARPRVVDLQRAEPKIVRVGGGRGQK